MNREALSWEAIPALLVWGVVTWTLAGYLFRSLPAMYAKQRWLNPRLEQYPEYRRLELLRSEIRRGRVSEDAVHEEVESLRAVVAEKARLQWWQVVVGYLLNCVPCQHGWAAILILCAQQQWSGFAGWALAYAGAATLLNTLLDVLKSGPTRETPQPAQRIDWPIPGVNGPRQVPVSPLKDADADQTRGCKDCPG